MANQISVPTAWPRHLPFALEVPQTSLWFNLGVAAARYPDKAAYTFFGSELSYRDLMAQAESVAGWLHQHGVRAGDRVLVQMQNCPQFVTAFYGVLRANAVVVPVNPMNRAEEIEHYLADSGARVVICSSDVVENIVQATVGLSADTRPQIVVTRYADAMSTDAQSPLDAPPSTFASWLYANPDWNDSWYRWTDVVSSGEIPPPHTAGPHDVAMLPYTSGTTGKPKGCIHTHATLMNNAVGTAMWQQMSAESRSLTVLPMFHITGLVAGVLSNVYLGATAFVMPRWDRELAARLISVHRLTNFTSIPTMLIDLLGTPNLDSFDLSSLRNLCGGGSAMPAAVADRLQQQLGVAFAGGYGLTETASMTHMNPLHRIKQQCLGIPVFGVDARIIDPETGAQLTADEYGEIVIRGPSLFKGYWNQREATAQSFIELDESTYFRTGDLGYVDGEGYFFLTDRIKRMINASGFKVWPAEVEAMLYGHPAIQDACVVAAQDPYRGETVKAYIVAKPGTTELTDEALIAWAKTQMAVYKVPRIVEFVDQLPMSGSGKVLWRQLQENGA